MVMPYKLTAIQKVHVIKAQIRRESGLVVIMQRDKK